MTTNTATFQRRPSMKLSKKLSFGEEVANSVTHAVGAVAMLILLPITAIYAYENYGLEAAVGMSIFVISLFLMFLSSTIYHAMAYDSPHKYVLRIIDHSMIYIAIAGSYTPVALSLVGGWLGYSIIVLQWGSTLFGILYKIFAKRINEKFSLFLYLLMGWLIIFVIPSIISQTGPAFWLLMVAGGLSYTVGAAFYAKKKPYFHMIWHLFIMLASALQYIGIVYYML
ncbi:PAQR family membrane homeostasis protein TrhA [Streptococcus dentiloxodontae]